MKNEHPKIVLLIGVSPRSGTNFLASALELHPSLQMPDFAKEDHLFEKTSLLTKFSELTTRRWSCWNKGQYDVHSERDLLMASIGCGLVRHFKRGMPDQVVPMLKTPLTAFTRFNLGLPQIEHALQLFPNAKIVFLQRDGRDLVASACKTWSKKPFLLFFIRWLVGCRLIEKFETNFRSLEGIRWTTLRYEDLLSDPQSSMVSLLKFLGFSDQDYPWDEMKNMPILGSSELSASSGEVSWTPVAKPADFNPIGRRKALSPIRKFFFRTIGRKALEKNAYELE